MSFKMTQHEHVASFGFSPEKAEVELPLRSKPRLHLHPLEPLSSNVFQTAGSGEIGMSLAVEQISHGELHIDSQSVSKAQELFAAIRHMPELLLSPVRVPTFILVLIPILILILTQTITLSVTQIGTLSVCSNPDLVSNPTSSSHRRPRPQICCDSEIHSLRWRVPPHRTLIASSLSSATKPYPLGCTGVISWPSSMVCAAPHRPAICNQRCRGGVLDASHPHSRQGALVRAESMPMRI